MANEKMSSLLVSEITRLLMQARTHMLGVSPIAQRIQQPDADTDTVPMHPGAKSFYSDGQSALLERVQNIAYSGFAALSLLGSAFVWLMSRLRAGAAENPVQFGARLLEILRSARSATLEQLDELEHALDDLVETLVARRARNGFGAEEAATFAFGVSQVRDAIHKRRLALTSPTPPPAAD